MKFLKSLFRIKSKVKETVKEIKPDLNSLFSIEYYPITDKYFPKYKNLYLKQHYLTGIIETLEPYLFTYAGSFDTEKKAKDFIELFKEQKLKVNVKTIKL